MSAPRLLVSSLALGLASGCAPSAHLSREAVLGNVSSRAAGAAEVEAALEWAALEAFPLDALGLRDGADRPATDAASWRAAAWTWSLPCREARRRLLAARARATSAGLPGDVGLEATYRNHGGTTFGTHETAAAATLDLLGLLRLGRAPAAAALADAEVREAFGEVERAAWAAVHDVERARLAVAASRAREEALRTLVEQVREDGRRLAILEEHGFVPPDRLAAARAMSRRAERRLDDESALLADALAALSRASGLPPDAEALRAVTPENALPAPGDVQDRPVPPPGALLARVPRLRSARLAYATAEAVVRRATADAWPRIGVGPAWRVNPDAHLIGGALDVQLPWPGSVRGEVEAAVERRELARETLEDALRETLADAERRRIRLRRALDVLGERAPAIADGTRDAWRAARARLSVDVEALPTWTDRLERRIGGSVALVDAREAAARAALDLGEAVGPDAGREDAP